LNESNRVDAPRLVPTVTKVAVMNLTKIVLKTDRRLWALNWQAGVNTGWGVYGINLTLELVKQGERDVLWLVGPGRLDSLSPLQRRLLRDAEKESAEFHKKLGDLAKSGATLNIPVLNALGNQFGGSQPRFFGEPTIAMHVFERTDFSKEALDVAKGFDMFVVASEWALEVLKARGIGPTMKVLQGVDTSLFHPGPKAGDFRGRFVIFSGGKLEFRKGQDIVLAAFKAFRSKHPDAFLVTQWHNMWYKSTRDIAQAGHVIGGPEKDGKGNLRLEEWMGRNGISSECWLDVGILSNNVVPQVIREADVAVFASRCEGATNFVAMECMASGIPTVLSANTGHLDIINDRHCYPLKRQCAVQVPTGDAGMDGWGESSVEEVVSHLEAIYDDRSAACEKGAAGAEYMETLSWSPQTQKLVRTIDGACLPAKERHE
jgi:glycosyltransferase involved in cell wall biosynthesis